MNFNQIILWAIFIVPWISLFVLKKIIIKSYMPVAVFTALLVTLYGELSYTQKWFIIKETILPGFIGFAPFFYGIFFVGTLWIFYLTYKKFWIYIITNIIIDGAFAFIAHKWFLKLGIIANYKQQGIHIFIAFITIAIIAYGYQVWQDEALIKES